MATFPRTEAEIAELATRVIGGFNARTDLFPSPPVLPAELQSALDDFEQASHAAVSAAAESSLRYKAKAKALEALVDSLKIDIRYAEYTVKFDNVKLKPIGWSGRKARSSLKAPGITRDLGIVREGPGWISLDWKKPMDGGNVAVYKVQAKRRDAGDWEDVAVTPRTEIVLESQERRVEWEYCVFALNKAGEGSPSNIVTAVL